MNTLDKLKPGDSATILKLKNDDDMKRRLLDIGLVEGTKIDCLFQSFSKDPIAFLIRGAVIALRYEDMKKIEILV